MDLVERQNRIMDKLMRTPGQGDELCLVLCRALRVGGHDEGSVERVTRRLEMLWDYHFEHVREMGVDWWEAQIEDGG